MSTKTKYNPRTIPSNKEQVNFNLDAATAEKIRVIAFKDKRTKTDIFTDAVTAFVARWEKANGPAKA